MLTRDQILNTPQVAVKKVIVPEWTGEDGQPGQVYVRMLSARERDRWDVLNMPKKEGQEANLDNYRARFLTRVICDSRGNLILKPEDADLLGNKLGKPIDDIFEAAQEFNGMGTHRVKRLEDTEKNSAATNGEGNGFASPSPAVEPTLTPSSTS